MLVVHNVSLRLQKVNGTKVMSMIDQNMVRYKIAINHLILEKALNLRYFWNKFVKYT